MSKSNVVRQEDLKSYKNPYVTINNAVQVEDTSCTQKQVANGDNPLEPRTQNQHDIKHKMYIFFREICLLLLLVFTYAAFQNTIPKSSKSPNAYPFFPVGSLVKDWYHGQLSDAIELASESDLAFIMYYAPWDAESQSVRHEFSIVAQQMHSEIHFAAINCWHPTSECRQQYNKIYSWPVLMAYPAHGRGIQYRGPRKAEYMLKFLNSVRNPFIRITSLTEVPKYQSIFDATVVAQTNGKLGDNNFGVFYYTALQFLERDPFRDVVFLVCTQNEHSVLSLHLWNTSLLYTSEWHPDKLITWLSDNLHQVSTWVFPTGGKSESLSSYLQPGPALILFTPKNPLYTTIDYYSVLHDVALNYYNCDFNPNIQLIRVLNLSVRKEHNLEYKKLRKKCAKNPTIVTYNTKTKLNAKKFYSNSSVECVKQNLRRLEEDLRCSRNLQHLEETKKCRNFRQAQRLHPAIFAPFNLSFSDFGDNVTGLACRTNATLSFLALDSLQFHYFAEGLGIDVLNLKDKSAVVILNPALETHHVMLDPFNTTNLEVFIRDFSKGFLLRTLSSSVAIRQFTHHYEKTEFCDGNATKFFCIPELNTTTFLPTVMNNNMAVVVMYYSTKCAFCAGVSHNLLTVAKILEPVKNLHFTRIDGDNQALPWEYSMHHYPNILYFPSRRKSESRIYPQNVPITVTNLLSFILANVEYHIKINVMWAICNQTTFDDDFIYCIRTIKHECFVQIGQILKVYRLSCNNQQRRDLLKHLEMLRSLHFLLESPLRKQAIDKHVRLLRFVDKVPQKYAP